MTSAASAIEAAAYEALHVAELTDLAPVYQHVPPDTPAPVVVIGDIDLEGFATKGADRDRRGALSVTTVVGGEARKPLLEIQEKVEALLDGVTVAVTGWTIQFTFAGSDGFLSSDPVDEDSEAGETYVGNSRFNVLALNNS